MNVLLVNTNRIQPPIAPLALDYIGTTLAAEGHHVDLLDITADRLWSVAAGSR